LQALFFRITYHCTEFEYFEFFSVQPHTYLAKKTPALSNQVLSITPSELLEYKTKEYL